MMVTQQAARIVHKQLVQFEILVRHWTMPIRLFTLAQHIETGAERVWAGSYKYYC